MKFTRSLETYNSRCPIPENIQRTEQLYTQSAAPTTTVPDGVPIRTVWLYASMLFYTVVSIVVAASSFHERDRATRCRCCCCADKARCRDMLLRRNGSDVAQRSQHKQCITCNEDIHDIWMSRELCLSGLNTTASNVQLDDILVLQQLTNRTRYACHLLSLHKHANVHTRPKRTKRGVERKPVNK